MKYKIALQRSKEGYGVSVPGLPGCWSQGATEAEALSMSPKRFESISAYAISCSTMSRYVRSTNG